MAEDIEKLAGWARSQGWRVDRDVSGYRRFYARTATTWPGTRPLRVIPGDG